MKKVKIRELSGNELDYAVAVAAKEKYSLESDGSVQNRKVLYVLRGDSMGRMPHAERFSPSTNANDFIYHIEKEVITIAPLYKQDTHRVYTNERIGWWAGIAKNEFDGVIMEGKTALEAACRAFVFYKLGDVVEILE